MQACGKAVREAFAEAGNHCFDQVASVYSDQYDAQTYDVLWQNNVGFHESEDKDEDMLFAGWVGREVNRPRKGMRLKVHVNYDVSRKKQKSDSPGEKEFEVHFFQSVLCSYVENLLQLTQSLTNNSCFPLK